MASTRRPTLYCRANCLSWREPDRHLELFSKGVPDIGQSVGGPLRICMSSWICSDVSVLILCASSMTTASYSARERETITGYRALVWVQLNRNRNASSTCFVKHLVLVMITGSRTAGLILYGGRTGFGVLAVGFWDLHFVIVFSISAWFKIWINVCCLSDEWPPSSRSQL